MKPNLSIATGLRRLSSDRGNENPFITSNISPQSKANQFSNKASYNDLQSKKNIGSSLKGLLSPVDYKLVELQTKANSQKLEEESSKPSPKGSARITGLNGTDQSNDTYTKAYLHKKKKSFDSKVDSQIEEVPGTKTKTGNTNSLNHTRSQPSTNIYLKDVEYVVNPMFSPLNGPPKYSSHRQSDSTGETSSPKSGQLKKTGGLPEGKLALKVHDTYDSGLRKESNSAKITPKASLNQFFDLKKGLDQKTEGKMEESSSEEFQTGTKMKAASKDKGGYAAKNRKKSPSITISPRLEGYSSAPYLGIGHPKTVQHATQIGSLYSRQREEYQEMKQANNTKSSPKKGQTKTVKKDTVLQKQKQAELLSKAAKKYEPYMKDDEEIQVRPRSTKLSDPNIQKDINSSIFSAFNNQSKRNSAAQVYSPSTGFESNLQSTRSAVDRSEKQYFSKGDSRDEQKSHKSTNPKDYGMKPGSVESELKLSSEGNLDDLFNLTKKHSADQATQAKFLLLRKQVQEKRSHREFKSADQNMFDMQYGFEVNEKRGMQHKELSSTKQGSDIQGVEPDTTYTSVKHQTQLSDIFSRVNKILDMYQKKEKTWEDEKRKLLAEIQLLRTGKQLPVKGSFI